MCAHSIKDCYRDSLKCELQQPIRPVKKYIRLFYGIHCDWNSYWHCEAQASNDPETNDPQTNSTGLPPAVGPTNWADITPSQFTVIAPGEVMWNVSFVGYTYVRLAYTDTSGGSSTATADIIVNGKGS